MEAPAQRSDQAPALNPRVPLSPWQRGGVVVLNWLVFSVIYRLVLQSLAARWLQADGSLSPYKAAFGIAWPCAYGDVPVAIALGLAASLVAGLTAKEGWRGVAGRIGQWILGGLLFALALLGLTHMRVSLALHTGLSWEIARETLHSGEVSSLLYNARPLDLGVLATLACVLLMGARLPWQRSRWSLVALMLAFCATRALPAATSTELPVEMGYTPITYLLSTAMAEAGEGEDSGVKVEAKGDSSGRENVEESGNKPSVLQRARPLQPPAALTATDDQAGGLFLTDPDFSGPQSPETRPPDLTHDRWPKQAWNVVWVVMESTGRRYFEGETHPTQPPMPFLRELAAKGWYLAGHRSPSNSSATSIFAQFSGIYPVPAAQMFSVAKDNHVPGLFSLLPAQYEKFLYTPGKLTYFFPKAFLQHQGLNEMVGFDETDVTRNPGGEGLSKDEPEVVTRFLQRLHRAREPFVGVYYSYVAHWEYTDYGTAWQRYGGGRLIDHYHNNLWLLDRQIKRIYEQLEADGRLDRTILVFVGDHGEAFGQHERNWAHARGSYEENFQTPAVLWQPRIFAPKVDKRDSLHIDLLPSVLDALGVPFDRAMVQGESLWQAQLRRNVALFWGNEGTVSGIWRDQHKLRWLTAERRCEQFDLQKDPTERHPLPCGSAAERLALIKRYQGQQRGVVPAYSQAVERHERFQGRQLAQTPAVLPVASTASQATAGPMQP